MARQAVESKILIRGRAPKTLEGRLIQRTATHTVFRAKKPGGQRQIAETIANTDVIAYGQDKIIFWAEGPIGRRPVQGVVEHTDKGIVIDGMTYNPAYVECTADYGTDVSDAAPKTGKVKPKR